MLEFKLLLSTRYFVILGAHEVVSRYIKKNSSKVAIF